MDQKLFNTIKKYEKDIILFIQEMIKIPSFDREGSNALADFLSQKLESLSYEAHLLGRGADYSVLYYPHTNSGKSLWLSAPLDTASPGTISKWAESPFSGHIKSGKIYGRGSADCKTTIAFYIYGLKALFEVYPELKGNVIVSFDGGEHNGDFSGLKSILEENFHADACIVGYPNNDEIFIGARGYVRLKVSILGKAAHTGSRKHLGINAIDKAIPFLQKLQNYHFSYKKSDDFSFGPKLTISMINAGSAINVVPDRCEIFIDIRTVPSQHNSEIVADMQKILEELRSSIPDFQYDIQVLNGEEAYLSDSKNEIIQLFQDNAEETFDKKIPLSVCGPANDGNVIASKLKIPVICGFGCHFENLHGFNESVTIEDIVPTAYTYMKTIKDFLDK